MGEGCGWRIDLPKHWRAIIQVFSTPPSNRWVLGLMGCLVGGGMVSPASAQDAPQGTISTVEFKGLSTLTPAVAQDLARIRPGDELSTTALDEAVTRMLRSGRFLAATYSVSQGPEGAVVTFQVRERLRVSLIEFDGNSKFRAGQLKEVLSFKVGDPVDSFAVRDGRDAMIAKYREAGYSNVAITYDQARLDNKGELVYSIQEGRRERVTKIIFKGCTAFTDGELKKHIDTKTYIWIFRAGAFDKDRAETDVGRLQNFLRDEGFLDAKVGYRAELAADQETLTVEFTIEEGTRYVIEDLRITGNAFYPTEELTAFAKSRIGAFVRQVDLDADVKTIQTRYGEDGFIYATVRARRVFSEAPGKVKVTIEIKEGEQFKVGRVAVRGNTRTKDKVVRRELNLYPPDDLFNLTEAREAEKRLVETRVFSSARVTPVGDEPGVRDVIVDVTEADRMGDFLFGAGVTSNSGVIGSIVFDLYNFDLWDTPRTWAEFLKFKSFIGGGQRLRIELQPGTEVSRASINFTEPYLFDRPLRYDTSLFFFERERDGYDENRFGSVSSFGKRFNRGLLRGWSGELAFRSEIVDIDNIDLLASNEIRDDKGNNLIGSIKGTLVRDRTDNRLVPSKGDRLRVAFEQFGLFGGDHFFGRATAAYSWYTTLHVDAKERKGVLGLRGEAGLILGDAPVFERFYAGGTGSIRGFEYRGVGPRDGLDRNNVGGSSLVLMSAEYSFPVYEEMVRGFFFVDMGTVESGPWRAAIGPGVRLTIDFFGPFPLELALGVPILEDDEDEDQLFSFVIGNF